MSEAKIQVSFKLPNGTIPLFRGDSPEEVETLIQAAVVSQTFIGSLEAFAEAAGIGKAPSAMAKLVIKIGRKRASEASKMASYFDFPCSRSWLANSTIKIPFLVTNPINITVPI